MKQPFALQNACGMQVALSDKKISESAESGEWSESGEWDSLGGFRWNLRKIEMKPTFMARLCHEFGKGVSLALPISLKIFFSPLKKNATELRRQSRSQMDEPVPKKWTGVGNDGAELMIC